jgi:poly(3-hydroxybutyrate) depolymerase
LLANLAAVAALVSFPSPLQADVLERTQEVTGASVRFKVVLPLKYDAARAYPAVLVFGGGPQNMRTVDTTLARNFIREAERRGYIVIAPAAPEGDLFFQGGDRIFPEFLKLMLAEYKVQGGKFHVAGPSNGGIAAMHVAAAYPQYFLSATAFPGYLWQPSDEKLQRLSGICVFMYVGEFDEYNWHREMKREVDFLTARGTIAKYAEERGQPHRLDTLAGPYARRLFDGFDSANAGCRR